MGNECRHQPPQFRKRKEDLLEAVWTKFFYSYAQFLERPSVLPVVAIDRVDDPRPLGTRQDQGHENTVGTVKILQRSVCGPRWIPAVFGRRNRDPVNLQRRLDGRMKMNFGLFQYDRRVLGYIIKQHEGRKSLGYPEADIGIRVSVEPEFRFTKAR